MLRKIEANHMGKSNLKGLHSIFHFSFGEYYNSSSMNFGALRVINDELINMGEGFDIHPHRDMEIISYVVDGELTYADSMENKKTLNRGHVQYMSAGTGVMHSEHNYGTETLRILQIWMFPDKKGYTPKYGDFRFDWNLRKNKWLKIVSDKSGDAPIKTNQDVTIYVREMVQGEEAEFIVDKGRQAYLVQVEGQARINNIQLNAKDAIEVIEENIVILANSKAHYLVIEMKITEHKV
jgi:redox-sensitive bicupin YhaK (pirin superfamily)